MVKTFTVSTSGKLQITWFYLSIIIISALCIHFIQWMTSLIVGIPFSSEILNTFSIPALLFVESILIILFIIKLRFAFTLQVRLEDNKIRFSSSSGEEVLSLELPLYPQIILDMNEHPTSFTIQGSITKYHLEQLREYEVLYFQILRFPAQTRTRSISNRANSPQLTLSFWGIVCGILELLILQNLFSTPLDINPFFLLLGFLGLYLVFLRPIYHHIGQDLEKIENILGWSIIAIFSFYFFIIVVMPRISFDMGESTGCGKKSPLRLCYSVTEQVCNAVWKQTEPPCIEELKKLGIHDRPGMLTGPTEKRCRNAEFDKKLRYMRTTINDAETCQTLFNNLEEYLRTRNL